MITIYCQINCENGYFIELDEDQFNDPYLVYKVNHFASQSVC